MRFVVIAHIPTETGNRMVNDPKFAQTMENYLKSVKAEAAYFLPDKGERTFLLVIDLASPDMLPVVSEPLFQNFNAKVEFHPAMIFEDVKKGLQAAKK